MQNWLEMSWQRTEGAWGSWKMTPQLCRRREWGCSIAFRNDSNVECEFNERNDSCLRREQPWQVWAHCPPPAAVTPLDYFLPATGALFCALHMLEFSVCVCAGQCSTAGAVANRSTRDACSGESVYSLSHYSFWFERHYRSFHNDAFYHNLMRLKLNSRSGMSASQKE